MLTIYKYPLQVTDVQEVEVPKGAEVLCVQVQGTVPCLWAKVNDGNPPSRLVVYTVGTGHPFPQGAGRYVGTYQLKSGGHGLVFHVFTEG